MQDRRGRQVDRGDRAGSVVEDVQTEIVVARARSILGRTATLEVRMVDDSIQRGTETTASIPYGSELVTVGNGAPVVGHQPPRLGIE